MDSTRKSSVTILEAADTSFEFSEGVLAGFKQLVYGPHLSPAPSRSPSPSPPGSDLSPAPSCSHMLPSSGSSTTVRRDGPLESGLGGPIRRDQLTSATGLPEHALNHPSARMPANEPVTRGEKRKLHEKLRSKENKRRKKEKTDEYIPRDSSGHAKKHLAGASHISTSFDSEKMPISKAGFIALRSPDSATTYKLEDFIGPDSKFNMKLVKWNGKESMVTTDKVKRITTVCVSKPEGDESWEELQQRAAQAIESARSRLHFSKKDQDHRRGGFPALAVGISHGGGQPYPKMRRQDPRNQDALQDLLSEPAFERISGHATGAFAQWAPRLCAYENRYLTELIEHDRQLRRENKHPKPNEEELRRVWPRTPWAATTFNFGPQTVCFKHADYNNLAFGWCAITALGTFDHTKGGHLILWDLGIIIEFPAGCTILIPSAAIHHSNVIVGAHERRYSVTQYSAGGIFRWVDNNFQSVVNFREKLTPDERAAALERLSEQLEFGLSLYSDIAELEKKHGVSFKYAEE